MKILEFGMRNKNSKWIWKRILAKFALFISKKYADQYEDWIVRQSIEMPEQDEEAFNRLMDKINTWEEEQRKNPSKS